MKKKKKKPKIETYYGFEIMIKDIHICDTDKELVEHAFEEVMSKLEEAEWCDVVYRKFKRRIKK